MNGGEGIVCAAKSSWQTCVSVQGKAESTRSAVGLAYCFIVWEVIEIEPIFFVGYVFIIGH